MELALQIIRFVDDDPQPGIVACAFVDADKREHTIIDKVPIFTDKLLDGTTTYPQPGTIRCKEVARWKDPQGRDLVRVDIGRRLFESTEGLSEFVVLSNQLLGSSRTGRPVNE